MPAMAGHSSGSGPSSSGAGSGGNRAAGGGTRSAGGVGLSPSSAASPSGARGGSASVGGAPYRALHVITPNSTSERMYSAKQLTEALKSGLAAVKDQLQVLAILDGTALSWPGVSQSVDDLDFLTDMVAQTTNRLEGANKGLQTHLDDSVAEASELRDSLSTASKQRDDLQRQLNTTNRELREARGHLDETKRELQQVRQETWTLEKQRADTATELDRVKQDLDFREGELRTLRDTSAEQASSITSLREELAARKADVGHLKQLVGEVRSANDHLKQQLQGAQEAAASAQGTLQHVRSEKQHYEREVGRLGEECSKLSSELERTARDLARVREWQDVLKKVEADKLREEQDAHARTRSEAEAKAAEGDKREALLRAEGRAREDRLAGRDSELDMQKKANALLQLQIKDLQKQLTLCQNERTAAAASLEGQRGASNKLQADIQRMRLEWAQRDKERAVAESAAKEAAAADKARLQAQLDEATREATLARTLSDSWQRELREGRSRVTALSKELEAAKSQLTDGKVEHVRSGAAAEGQVAVLRSQLASKDEEVRRIKFDAASVQKQLEKAIERLQREVDASAAEVARLKAGEDVLFTRLPPVAARSTTIHDELEALRKALRDRMAGSGAGAAAAAAAGAQGMSPSEYHNHHNHHHVMAPPGSALPALVGASSAPLSERPPHLRNKTR